MSDVCIINALEDAAGSDYRCLSIWGKPVIYYSIKTAIDSNLFDKICVYTDSLYVKHIVAELFGQQVICDYDERLELQFANTCRLSGRAVMLTPEGLRKAYNEWDNEKIGISVIARQSFEYCTEERRYVKKDGKIEKINLLEFYNNTCSDSIQEIVFPEDEALVINCANDFELVLPLMKKRNNKNILLKQILNRIEEKKDVFRYHIGTKSCCFVGHSQLDNWNIKEICGYNVRNCGIGGISSFQYYDLILKEELLSYKADFFVVMHGTNDIVYDYSLEEISESIMNTMNYIRKASDAPILFVKCMHTNGRMDRDNKMINAFNDYVCKRMPGDVIVVDVSAVDDPFGNLKPEYTTDGLHLSELGYQVFEDILTNVIKENI